MRPRLKRILPVPLVVAAVTMCPPASAAGDWECSIVVPVADRLENVLDLVSPSGTPPYVAGQIRNALSPLNGLRGPAAVDLRLRSDMLAAQIDASDPYRPASPELLAGDLVQARQQLAVSRAACAP
ncbi:hypothetical protein [Mycobacterium sp. UM_CSW]|uniref:hypothetical protein n=1 Tax=Mycobacterium sp. UM_CSW TaxID=1370119 RepID=UPI00082AE043|nr:hypothetical protein [Mycobacterium sp. UM_CSW]